MYFNILDQHNTPLYVSKDSNMIKIVRIHFFRRNCSEAFFLPVKILRYILNEIRFIYTACTSLVLISSQQYSVWCNVLNELNHNLSPQFFPQTLFPSCSLYFLDNINPFSSSIRQYFPPAFYIYNINLFSPQVTIFHP